MGCGASKAGGQAAVHVPQSTVVQTVSNEAGADAAAAAAPAAAPVADSRAQANVSGGGSGAAPASAAIASPATSRTPSVRSSSSRTRLAGTATAARHADAASRPSSQRGTTVDRQAAGSSKDVGTVAQTPCVKAGSSRPSSSGRSGAGGSCKSSGAGCAAEARDNGTAANASPAVAVAGDGGGDAGGSNCANPGGDGGVAGGDSAVAPVEVWHCAVSLAFLQRFAADVVQPGWTTYDILQRVVLPATAASKCRYVDTLPPSASSTLTYFVSYAWSMPFTTLVELLSHHLHSADPEKVFCWVDVLAINQHPGRQQSRDLQDLEEAVRLASGTLVCLDPACVPFSRIWCLFEWWTTLRVRGLRQLMFLAEPATRRRLSELYQGIDIRNAQATVASDRDRILAAIGDALDLVNAQLKLLFLLEPYDTTAAVPAMIGNVNGDTGGAVVPADVHRPTGGTAGPAVYGSNAASMSAAGTDVLGTPNMPGGDWTSGPIERWLQLPPEDRQYRALALIGPVGCGKTHGAAAAFTALTAADEAATAASAAAAPTDTTTHVGTSVTVTPDGRSDGPKSVRRGRPAAAHFCRSGDAASTDPLVLVRSLAFQLACLTHGSLSAYLQKRYLGLSKEAIAGLSRLETAFNTLLLHPLNALFPPPPDEVDDAPPPPRWAAAAAAEAVAAAPDEVVLLVDGVDEAEAAGGLPHQNRILQALRDLFPQLPRRVRLLLSCRPRPDHVVRSLAHRFDPWVVSPPADSDRIDGAAADKPHAAAQEGTPSSAAPNHLLATLRRLLPPVAACTSAPPPLPPSTTSSGPRQPSSLHAAYAALFSSSLSALSRPQVAGVASLLELLLASPEPPALHVIAGLGLAPFLPCLPGWGAAFHSGRGYRLHVVHRSLLEWLRGGREDGDAGGGSTFAAPAASVLAAAGVTVEAGRGHARLADWVLSDLRGSKRPQTYSLRYAIFHLAHAATADSEAPSSGAGGAGTTGAAGAVRQSRVARVRQLNELMLDLRFWEQVYTSRLGSEVLRDLLTLPGLDSPTARDVVRMIQRDHATLERDPSLLPNLAFETPLGSATRAAAAAAAAATAADAAAATGASAAAGAAATTPAVRPCAVIAPVYRAWPACLATVSGETRMGLPTSINAVRFAPGGATFAAANNAGTVLVHDRQTGERVLRLTGHVDFVHDVAFLTLPSEDGSGGGAGGSGAGDGRRRAAYIVTAGSDRTIRFWDVVTGEELSCLRHHTRQLTCLAVSPDCTHLASADEDGAVRIWRLTPPAAGSSGVGADGRQRGTGTPPGAELLHSACCHTDAAFCAAFTPDGCQLASGGKDGCVRVWDVGSGAQVAQLDVASARTALGGGDGGGSDGTEASLTPPHMVKCVAYSPDGASLLAGLSCGDILVWRRGIPSPSPSTVPPSRPASAATAPPPSSPSPAVATGGQQPTSPGGGTGGAVSSGGGDSAAWVPAARLVGHSPQMSDLVVTRDGRLAFSCGSNNTVRVWDLEKGSQLAVLYGHTDYVLGCDLSADGRWLATAAADGTVRIWDAELAMSAPPPQLHGQGVMQAAVARLNGYIATASKDNTTGIWALPPLEPPPAPAAAEPADPSVSTAAEAVGAPEAGRQQSARATGVDAQAAGVELSDRPSVGAVSPRRRQPQGKDSQKAAPPEGPFAVSAAAAAAQQAACDAGLGMGMQLRGHTAFVATVAVAPDEVTLASGSYDRTVRVYRLDQPSRRELVLRSGHKAFVTALAFDAWGTRLVSCGGDGSLAVWDAAAWQQAYFATASREGEEKEGNADVNCEKEDGGEELKDAAWMSPLQTETHPELTCCWSLACSPVDYLVAGGHSGAAISIWDAMQPDQPRQPSLLYAIYRPTDSGAGANGYNGHVYGVAWSPDGKRLAGGYSGHRGGHARVFDITTGEQVSDIAAHEKDVWCVAFDPTDGNLLATCSYDGIAAVWALADLRSPRRVATLKGHRGSLRTVAFLTRQTQRQEDPVTPQRQPTSDAAAAAAAAAAGAAESGGGVATAGPSAGAAGEGSDGVGGAAGTGFPCGLEKWIMTTGTDATVRLWSYAEAVRRQELSYMCPWALTG